MEKWLIITGIFILVSPLYIHGSQSCHSSTCTVPFTLQDRIKKYMSKVKEATEKREGNNYIKQN